METANLESFPLKILTAYSHEFFNILEKFRLEYIFLFVFTDSNTFQLSFDEFGSCRNTYCCIWFAHRLSSLLLLRMENGQKRLHPNWIHT